MNGIEVKNISKTFGRVRALHDVSVTFEGEKIYGLLGRNGAGKSTLFNLITNRIFPDSGEVFVDGERSAENDAALQKIFMMSEKNYYPLNMRLSEALRWTGEFYKGCDQAYGKELAARFGLDMNKRIRSLSTGYSSIFKIILTLSSNAPYLLFDEPILGLDANHRDMFYKILLEKYSETPCTMILSTHLIEEVSGVIEDVVIIKEGEILKQATQEELLSGTCMISGTAAAVDQFAEGRTIIGSESLGGLKTIYISGQIARETLPENIELSRIDLQKLFIQLTNQEGGRIA
jgi:ABC-2 type transport system ATP-binding protein